MPRINLITANFRRDTAANWTAANPVLGVDPVTGAPEIGMEWTGTRWLIKMGDGSTAWNSLPYSFFNLGATAATALAAGATPTTSFNPATGQLTLGIPSGIAGAAGAAGAQGPTGATGITGTTGQAGPSGPSGTNILGALASALTLTNSTAETTVMLATVPANSLGTTTALVRILARGYITQSAAVGIGTSLAFTVRIKYGGQVFTAMSGVALRASLISDAAFTLEADLFMKGGSASSQSIYSEIRQAGSAGAFDLTSYGGTILPAHGSYTVDSTLAQNLIITAQTNSLVSTTSLVVEQVRVIRLG